MTDHDDIKAALARVNPTGEQWCIWNGWGPLVGTENIHAATRIGTSDEDSGVHGRWTEDGDLYGSRDTLEFVASAPTWLAELLAENERLTARAEAAEAERDQLREEARKFAQALGFGDGRTEPAATLAELVDPLTQAMSDSREHQECPVVCELCGERLAAVTCEACRGSGCLPNAEMAYLECGTCAGVGKVHNGCAEMTYAQLAASAEAAEQTIQRVRELAQHYDGRAYADATGAILRALDGGEQHG